MPETTMLDVERRWRFVRDLQHEITDEEWSRLRTILRMEATRHIADEQMYEWADECPHDVGSYDECPEDGVHVVSFDDESLICLASPTRKVCLCGDGYCIREGRIQRQAVEFWELMSAENPRLAPAHTHVYPAIVSEFGIGWAACRVCDQERPVRA